jgi:hypothetical protein
MFAGRTLPWPDLEHRRVRGEGLGVPERMSIIIIKLEKKQNLLTDYNGPSF